MKDHRTIAPDAPDLPAVEAPARAFGARRILHRNPFEMVYSVRADFGGFKKDYYVVDFGPRAAILAVKQARVLLTAQYRFLIDGVAWEIPGGRIESGESPAQAAQRECLEESGIFCNDPRPLITFRPGLDNVDNLTSVFYSEVVAEHRRFTPNPAEALAIAWVPLDDCVSLVLDRHVVDCVTVSAILAYRCMVARRETARDLG